MRPLLILLLLLCTLLAAADANLKCDLSLIKGIDHLKINLDDDTKTLTCVAGEKSLMAIKLNSKLYESLKCDVSAGWIAKKYKYSREDFDEYKVEEAAISLNIDCVEYCASTGESLHIEKLQLENDHKLGIMCNSEVLPSGVPYKPQLQYNQGESVFSENVYCDLEFGWAKGANGDAVIFRYDTSTPAHLECVKEDLKCDRSLIYEIDSSKFHFYEDTKTLSCVGGDNSIMAIEFNSQRYMSLTCDKSEGWRAKKKVDGTSKWTNTIADSLTELNVTCVERCAAIGMGIEVEKKTDMGDVSNTVTCVGGNNSLMAIKFDKRLHAALSCDLDDNYWKGMLTELDQIAGPSAEAPLNVTCVEYCAVTGVGIKFEKRTRFEKNDNIKITCESQEEQLMFGETRISQAVCTLDGDDDSEILEWKMSLDQYGHESIHRKDLGKTKPFECRLDVPTTTSTNTKPEEKGAIAEAQSGDQTPLIIVGFSIGAVIIGVIVVVVKLLLTKDKKQEGGNSEMSVKATEEGRMTKNKKPTGSDESMSDVDNASSGR